MKHREDAAKMLARRQYQAMADDGAPGKARRAGWVLAMLTAAAMGFAGSPATAQSLGQCAKEAAGCVVNVAKSAYYSVSAVGSALEFAALHPNCVADVVSGNPVTIGISSAIVGVAASGAISASSSSACKADLYGVAAKPIASAISEIIPDAKIKKFAAEAGAGYAGEGFEAIASTIPVPSGGAPTVAAQLVCGCAVAAAGAGMVDKLKSALTASAAAAESCSGTMGCLGGAALTALKDVGKAVGQVSVAVAKCAWTPNDCGESEAIPPAQYWNYNFEPFVAVYADLIVTESNAYCSTNSIYEYKTCAPSVELENKRTECLDYHKAHKASASTARAICNPMRDRVTSEAQVIINRRMADEVFPKEALKYAKSTFPLTYPGQYESGAFAVCHPPKSQGGSPKGQSAPGVDLTGAAYYTMNSKQYALTSQCIDEILASIGVDRRGDLVLNANGSAVTLLSDAKARAKKANWKFVDTFTAAYAAWEPRLAAIKNKYQVAIVKANSDDAVYLALNPEYAKAARDVYVAGVVACPPAGAAGQGECVREMRVYMGMQLDLNSKNPTDGYIDFSAWGSNPPKPYMAAMSLLEKVRAQKGNVNEAISGAVSWAMQDAANMLKTIPAKAVAAAKLDLKQQRERQNIMLSRAQDDLNDAYIQAKSRCKQASCTPKIEQVRQSEKVDEGNLLKTLVTGSAPELPFRTFDSYLAGMKNLLTTTRPKYKAVLDQEIFILTPADEKRLGAGASLVAGTPGTTGATAVLPKAGLPSGASSAPVSSQPVLNQAGGLPAVNPGIAAAVPKPGGTAAPQARVGMPGLPTMGSLPQPPKGGTVPGIAPGLVPPAPTPPPAPAPAVVAMQSPPPIVLSNQSPPVPGMVPGVAAALVPPFDAKAFRADRVNALGAEWLPQCKGNGGCIANMTQLFDRRINVEVQAITAGNPDYKNKAAVAAYVDQLDNQYDPQFQALIPKPAFVASDPPVPNGTVIPKGVPKIPKKIPGIN